MKTWFVYEVEGSKFAVYGKGIRETKAALKNTLVVSDVKYIGVLMNGDLFGKRKIANDIYIIE